MQRVLLSSSAIVSAGYDRESQQLEVEFQSGRIYRYREVPPGVFDFLLRAPSKGGYFNRMVEGRYAYEDVSEAPPEQDVLGALQASLTAVAGDHD
jgi:hypothetical protein